MMLRSLLVLLVAAALAASEVASVSAVLAATTAAPGNSLSTATSAWFAVNATGTAICAGVNASLDCGFGTRLLVGTTVATVAVAAKATSTYQVTVVDGTGPAGISTIVTARFVSTGTATAALTAGAADSLSVTLKIRGATPAGSYTGTIVVTDVVTSVTASFPISATH
ncbi:MAG TPA: hypothetical protein VGA38_11415 [Candidatus Limnocylindria bacterium]